MHAILDPDIYKQQQIDLMSKSAKSAKSGTNTPTRSQSPALITGTKNGPKNHGHGMDINANANNANNSNSNYEVPTSVGVVGGGFTSLIGQFIIIIKVNYSELKWNFALLFLCLHME